MLINEICNRNSYQAMRYTLDTVTLHDLQCIDVLKMIAAKKAIAIYDTGTGKTLLAAAFMKLLLREDPSRIFLMFIKKDQIMQTPAKLKKWANLSCIVTTADSKKSTPNFLRENLEYYNVIMLTHDCLHNEQVLEAIYQIKDKITGVIVDEAHEYNNFNSALSANMLKAILSRFEYRIALTATPIVSSTMQLARLSNLIDSERFPDAKRLNNDLVTGRFKTEYAPDFFINRSASDLGRTSQPRGFVKLVQPMNYQFNCCAGGAELFQICKGQGAINQANALIELVRDYNTHEKRGLVFISQASILHWVSSCLDDAGIKYACINGNTPMSERSQIEEDFAANKYDIILTSVKTAVDLDCDYVVFYEFTVAVSQMIGRAHRGLEPKVLDVYFIITKDTNELDYFVNNIYEKCQIVREILGKGNSAVEEVAQHLDIEC